MALEFADIREEFIKALDEDGVIAWMREALRHNVASYRDASEAAARVGDILGQVLMRHAPVIDITDWDVERLIPSALGFNHEVVSEWCEMVQEELNRKAGIGIRAVRPKFDGDRAYGMVKELRSNPEFFNIEKTFYDQLTNFTMSVVDHSIHDNADLQSKAGIESYVVRVAEGGACPWCRALVGRYVYSEVKETGNDVWRRHDNCRCTIDWYSSHGRHELVSSKEYHYRGYGGTPGRRSNTSKYRVKDYDKEYDEFMVQQINGIRKTRGWTYERALGFYHKNEDYYKGVYSENKNVRPERGK